jgi:CHAD domain-containing protein
MTEQIEKILDEFKAIQAKLPELRDLFWLKIDRYSESDQQRGVAFIEKSFASTDEEVTREKALQKLRAEFPGFEFAGYFKNVVMIL